MNISIVTLFPALYEPFVRTSLLGRALEQGVFSVDLVNMLSLCAPKERPDSPPYGPGAGMVLRPAIIQKAVEQQEARHGKAYKIFFSPHGKRLTQPMLEQFAQELRSKKHVMLLPARYEGMDARIEQVYADSIVSVGDFVLMGGDIPAMMVLEGMMRYIPGVVGKADSVEHDSFTGPLVDYPSYTEPLEWQGMAVPDIIRSGNHQAIEQWRFAQALQRTVFGHFDWLRSFDVTAELAEKVHAIMPEHYVALMHAEVKLKDGREGTSSVTSLDVHDIARSCRTYGAHNFFVVTPLIDQQKIVNTLLNFWETTGKTYNNHRSEAVQLVRLTDSLDDAIAAIEQKHGKRPIIIATSAQEHADMQRITFSDQELIWRQQRPVLFVFGTAFGLADSILKRCDYVLPAIKGFTQFNHLSVRCAVAVVLDRWLATQPTKP